jgi:hypothetical protein
MGGLEWTRQIPAPDARFEIARGWCGIDYGRCGIAYGWCGIAYENPPSPSFKRKKAIGNLRIISGRTQSTPATTDRLRRSLRFMPTPIAAAPVTGMPKIKSENSRLTVGKQQKKLAGIADELQVLGRGGRI